MSKDRLVTASQADAGPCGDPRVHAGEEVHDVAMLDHHALGLAGRARGVDDVGEMVGRDAARDDGRTRRDALVAVELVDEDDLGPARRQVARVGGCVETTTRARESSIMYAIRSAGIGRIERHVGAAGLQDGEHGDDQLDRAVEIDADELIGTDAERDELIGQPIGAGGELAVAERLAFEDDGDVVGMARDGFARRARGCSDRAARPAPCRSSRAAPASARARRAARSYRRRRPGSAKPARNTRSASTSDRGARGVECAGIVEPTRALGPGRDHEHRVRTGRKDGARQILSNLDGHRREPARQQQWIASERSDSARRRPGRRRTGPGPARDSGRRLDGLVARPREIDLETERDAVREETREVADRAAEGRAPHSSGRSSRDRRPARDRRRIRRSSARRGPRRSPAPRSRGRERALALRDRVRLGSGRSPPCEAGAPGPRSATAGSPTRPRPGSPARRAPRSARPATA